MAPTLKPSTSAALDAYITSATTGPTPTLPGAIVHITDALGDTLFTHATPGLSPTTLFSIFSCSKLIGAIAFLQLVDQGLAALDDASLVEKHLPELWSKRVLIGSHTAADGTLEYEFEERKADITPRMLLNHTNGTGMSLFNAELRDYLGDAATTNEGNDYFATLLRSPLLWQPGTKTNYGQGLDWMSVLLERLTNKSLEELLRESIFAPLGIKIGGFKGEWGGSVVAGDEGVDFWPGNVRLEDGTFVGMPGFAEKKVEREDAWPRGKTHVQSVAGGLVMSAADLARVYGILLPQNAGIDPVTGTRILSAASVAEIATVNHAESIRHDSRNIPSSHPMMLPYEVQAEHVDPRGCYSLGCGIQGEEKVLRDGRRGRSKGTVYWVGAANIAFWIDGEKGVVVIAVGNFFPFGDAKGVEFVEGLEGLIYEGLEG